jgi:hypothetical protein
MVSSNATEETISFFLDTIRTRFPDVTPQYFMTDKDHAQINAIKRRYPTSMVELCWWHVLHAWQQHFSITNYPDLWDLLKTWVRITDENRFQERWSQIQKVAPPSVIEYLKTNWLPIKEMWSAVHRVHRSARQDCDTNMLVEAWHHLLKGKFMQGKRNRRLDHLIYVLVFEAIPYFIHRHHLQAAGFEGGDVEVQERLRIQNAAKQIPEEDIEEVNGGDSDLFNVKSQTTPNLVYSVDLEAYDCTCPSFPRISSCKHILAVQHYFKELCEPIKATEYDIISAGTALPPVDDANDTPGIPEQTITNDTQAPAPSSSHIKDDLLHTLSTLVHRVSNLSPSKLDPNNTTTLHETIASFSRRLPTEALLPRAKHVAPNQHSWPETAAVMGVGVKGKKRTVHTDPYSGGERSGKRAKEDALGRPGPTNTNTPPQPSQIMPASSSAIPFSPIQFNITDTAALEALKRPQLFQLCDLYGVAKAGTNSEIVAKLAQFSRLSLQTYLQFTPP